MCAAADPSQSAADRRVASGCDVRVLRSPSRDSVATDLSLLSLSSLGSGVSKAVQVKGSYRVSASSSAAAVVAVDVGASDRKSWNGGDQDELDEESEDQRRTSVRGQSPKPDVRGSRNNLQVPCERYGLTAVHGKGGPLSETLFEEESDLIRSCGALSSVLGLRRSFSTSDISQGPSSEAVVRPSASELALTGGRDELTAAAQGRLDYASRSCSTWVAVGDVASTSQLPSPQGSCPAGTESPAITAAELVRSVNKKVRQTYIKRRLLTTYKALERIAQSELNLQAACRCELSRVSKTQVSREILKLLRRDFDPQHGPGLLGAAVKSLSLTVKDVEREKGKPLTKYERNMMIFNWLHTLEDTAFDRMA